MTLFFYNQNIKWLKNVWVTSNQRGMERIKNDEKIPRNEI